MNEGLTKLEVEKIRKADRLVVIRNHNGAEKLWVRGTITTKVTGEVDWEADIDDNVMVSGHDTGEIWHSMWTRYDDVMATFVRQIRPGDVIGFRITKDHTPCGMADSGICLERVVGTIRTPGKMPRVTMILDTHLTSADQVRICSAPRFAMAVMS